MTKAEARVLVRQDLDGRSVTALPDARVDTWLDATLIHVCNPNIYMHPRLFVFENVTLVTGDNDYNLGATREVLMVLGVRNTTADQGYSLYPKNRKWFRRQRQDAEGKPSYYMHYSDPTNVSILKVYNSPAAQYNGQILEVEEYCMHEDWAAGEATVLETMWDEVLVAGAVWRGWKSLNQPVFQDRALADYAALINEIRERDGMEIIEDPRSMDIDIGGFGAPRFNRYGRY
jgi:hypothetical protein